MNYTVNLLFFLMNFFRNKFLTMLWNLCVSLGKKYEFLSFNKNALFQLPKRVPAFFPIIYNVIENFDTFAPSLPFLCVFMWPLRLLFWLKHLPQMWQPYGFSPVWIRKCLSRCPARSKILPQYEQMKHFFGLITWKDLLLLWCTWFIKVSVIPCKPPSCEIIRGSEDPKGVWEIMLFLSSPYGFPGKEKVLQEASAGGESNWAIPGNDGMFCSELLRNSVLPISGLFCSLGIHCWLSLSNAAKVSPRVSTPSLVCSFPPWKSGGGVIVFSAGSDLTCTGVGRMSSLLGRASSTIASSGRCASIGGFTSGISFCSVTWISTGPDWIPV